MKGNKAVYVVSVLLLPLVLYIAGMDAFSHYILRWFIYFEVRQILQEGEDEHLVTLKIPYADFCDGKVRFAKKHEIVYKGHWYDIKKVEFTPDGVIFIAYHDEKETILEELWEHYQKHKVPISETLITKLWQLGLFIMPAFSELRVLFFQKKKNCILNFSFVQLIFSEEIDNPPRLVESV